MKNLKPLFTFLIVTSVSNSLAQQKLSTQDIVRLSVSRSSLVKAEIFSLERVRRKESSLKSGFNPFLELGPGVGFTNGTSLLSQEFDLFGKRRSEADAAKAEVIVFEGRVQAVKFDVGAFALRRVSEFLLASDSLASAEEYLRSSTAILKAVRKRIEIDEAPKIHATRAEVEVLRAEQLVAENKAQLSATNAEICSMLGHPSDAALTITEWVAPTPPDSRARQLVPTQLIAKAELDAAKSQVRAAQTLGKPNVSAGISTDFWSLDRPETRNKSIGLQFMFRAPLGDRGENRFTVKAAESNVSHFEELLKEANLAAELERDIAWKALASTRMVCTMFETGILPKTDQMLISMQSGYEIGLVSLLEVLESQQTLQKLKRENAEAIHKRRLAEVRYLKATAYLPGLEVKN
jgi:outer membrane protein TolC